MYLSWDESSRLPLISIKVYVFHIVPECHALIWRTQISNFTLWDEPMGWLQLPLLVHVIEDIFILKRVSRGPFKLGKPNLQNSTVFSIVGHSGSPSCIYSLRFFFFFSLLIGQRSFLRKSRNRVIVEKAYSEEHTESVWVQEEKQKSCCFNWGNVIKEIGYMSIVKLEEQKM